MLRGAHARGEGCAITAADYSVAILYNGLGQYELAVDAAQKAVVSDEIGYLVVGAVRAGRGGFAQRPARGRTRRRRPAVGAHQRQRHPMGQGDRGALARALTMDGDQAEELHREAIEWLGRCRMAAELARARLSYGEWLRRESRRVDAREQLRRAHEAFAAMGADGFADRARRELLATGEKVRKRRDDTRDELTPQEEHIARLARDGRTNPEIGAELFLSPRTVEWHLRKVFTKLGISSRNGLHDALPVKDQTAEPT